MKQFQRSLPDRIRGRISTLDRGAEIMMFSFASFLAGVSLTIISAQAATVIAGFIAGGAGLVWFIRTRNPADLVPLSSTNDELQNIEIHKSQL